MNELGNFLLLGLGLGVAVLTAAVMLLIATKLLKFRRQEFKLAITVAGASMIVSLGLILTFGLISPIGLLIGLLAGIIVWVLLIKHFYEIELKKAVLAWLIMFFIGGGALLAPLIIAKTLLALNIFPMLGGGVMINGFSEIFPVKESIKLTAHGDFEATFVNYGGTYINHIPAKQNVTSVNITNDVSGPCSNIKIDQRLPLDKGDTLNIVASGCAPDDAKVGDKYSLDVVIWYDHITQGKYAGCASVSGGTIKGVYE